MELPGRQRVMQQAFRSEIAQRDAEDGQRAGHVDQRGALHELQGRRRGNVVEELVKQRIGRSQPEVTRVVGIATGAERAEAGPHDPQAEQDPGGRDQLTTLRFGRPQIAGGELAVVEPAGLPAFLPGGARRQFEFLQESGKSPFDSSCGQGAGSP